MKLKEYPINQIVKFNGIRLQVIKAVQGCRGCYFNNKEICPADIVGVCCPPWRNDKIIFRKFDENRKENLHKTLTIAEKEAAKKVKLWKKIQKKK